MSRYAITDALREQRVRWPLATIAASKHADVVEPHASCAAVDNQDKGNLAIVSGRQATKVVAAKCVCPLQSKSVL